MAFNWRIMMVDDHGAFHVCRFDVIPQTAEENQLCVSANIGTAC